MRASLSSVMQGDEDELKGGHEDPDEGVAIVDSML